MSLKKGALQTGDGLGPAPGLEVAIHLPSITEDLLLLRRHRATSLLHATPCPAIVHHSVDLLRATAHHRVIIDKKAHHL